MGRLRFSVGKGRGAAGPPALRSAQEIIYLTPQPGKRKAFFARKFYLLKKNCTRGLEDGKQPPEGGGCQPRQPAAQAEGPVQQTAHQGAEEGKVPGSPQKEGDGGVQPHGAGLQKDGAEEEGGADEGPEGQVGGRPEPPPGKGPGEQAQQVVEQAQGGPHPQAGQKDQSLALVGDAHPRNSRPRKEPWRLSSSS